MILKLLALMAMMLICPFLIGQLPAAKMKTASGNMMSAYISGLVIQMSVFEVFAIPMSFMKTSLTLLCRVSGCVIILLAVLGLITGRKNILSSFGWLVGALKRSSLILVAAALIMVMQAGYVTRYQHIDDDDAYYVATATTTLENDSLYTRNSYNGKKLKNVPFRYVMAAWPIYTAAAAKVSGIHPTILAHTIFPAMIIFWSYIVFALLAAGLFPGDRKKQDIFLLFVAVIHTFSGYSIYTASTFEFFRAWQGKAVLASFGAPVLVWGCIMTYSDPDAKIRDNSIWLVMTATAAACCMFSSTASMMVPVLTSGFLLSYACLRRGQKKINWKYIRGLVLVNLPPVICAAMYVGNIVRYKLEHS